MSLPKLTRRRFLRSAGVALALPTFDATLVRAADGKPAAPPRRMLTICTTLGLHVPFLVPAEAGADYKPTQYLDVLKDFRADTTVLSGLCHAEQAGANGHTSGMTWLTAVKHPGLGGFRNTISLDQFAVEKLVPDTRFSSLVLGTSNSSLSWTRSGVEIPADESPSRVFAKLFLEGTAAELKTQVRRLRDGQSILDDLSGETKKLGGQLGTRDREKLEEYMASVRDLEQRLQKAEAWSKRPKPKVDMAPPKDIANRADIIGRTKLMYDLIHLALQTDSSRIITLMIQGTNSIPPIEGITEDHHNLSHHGQDPQKIAQLSVIEKAEFQALADLLKKLKQSKEQDRTLLDSTAVLFGSNLGNSSSHDTRNLPLVLVGGGFKHGRHLAFDPKTAPPFSNLFVSMLQRLGVETDKFAAGTKTLTGLEMVG